MDILVSESFEEGFGVCTIGLVSGSVGAHGVRREEDNGVSWTPEVSSPVVSGAAGFEQDSGGLALCEEAKELRTREAMVLAYFPVGFGDSNLEDGLCQVNGDDSLVHGGLLLSGLKVIGANGTIMMPRKLQEESIPSPAADGGWEREIITIKCGGGPPRLSRKTLCGMR